MDPVIINQAITLCKQRRNIEDNLKAKQAEIDLITNTVASQDQFDLSILTPMKYYRNGNDGICAVLEENVIKLTYHAITNVP